jgi:His-Xaa-Ser system radical SAM maturase HxsB
VVGDYHHLSHEDFSALMHGTLSEDTPEYQALLTKRFIKTYQTIEDLRRVYKQLFTPKLSGPLLHIMVITKRCNHQCVYCHSAATIDQDPKFQMTEETARKTVDVIFQSKSDALTLEFQGGEPLENWPIVQFVTKYAREKEKETGKKLYIQLITNLTLMSEEKYAFLSEHEVMVSTSLDGPKEIHNRNRIFLGGRDRAHDLVTHWVRYINEHAPSRSLRINTAISTATRHTLQDPKAYVDFFVDLGMSGVFVRPLNPMGFAVRTWQQIGYTMDEFLNFYFKMVDYILELNEKGVKFVDKYSQIMLTKILSDLEPNYMDLRSPCGAGVGQIAYNYTGEVFTCDDARWLDEDTFKMGHVVENTLSEMLQTEVVANMVNASTNEGLYCDHCTYQPYCGICPVYNYASKGNIVTDQPNSDKCKQHKAMFDYLFAKLQDPKYIEIFRTWVFLGKEAEAMTSTDLSCPSLGAN